VTELLLCLWAVAAFVAGCGRDVTRDVATSDAATSDATSSDASTSDAAMGAAAGFVPRLPSTRGGSLNGQQLIADVTRATIDGLAAKDGYVTLFPAIAGHAPCDVQLSEISFTTLAPDNSTLANATAAVLIPTGLGCVRPDAGPHPLLVIASGTQPEAVRNADMNHWATQEAAIMYASQGIAVVMPDYLGDGNPALFPGYPKFPYHPYFHAQSEATTLLDSIRAVRAWSVELSGPVMLIGGSQGAHAAAAAVILARDYYPNEFDIVGAAFNAGPFDLPAMIRLARGSPSIHEIYDKAITAWAKTYNGGVPLTYPVPDEVTPISQLNDLLHASLPEFGFPVQLCGTVNDNVVPFEYTLQMQNKLAKDVVPLLSLPEDEIARAYAAFPSTIGDVHDVGGTLCIGEESAYLDSAIDNAHLVRNGR
jgi:hypothetical protein